MTEITNMIAQIGFPCFMCIAIMYFWRDSEKMRDKKMDLLIETINDLRLVVEKVITNHNEKEKE